jgi:LysR family transcriptional regulator, nod-box dependent transcriptional activator
MDFRGLDLNLLVALDALLAERNVTRAGARLHLSQSAMSGALARLRQFFGDDLLAQSGRAMVLTPLAASLAGPVRDILFQVQTTVAAKAEFVASESDRRFTIMASDFVLMALMAEVMPRVEREAPRVTFDLRKVTTSGIELLDRGEIDFLVVPEIFATDAHPREKLFEEGYTCVVWTENDKVGERMSFDKYLALGHVAIAIEESRASGFEEWFLRHYGFRRRIEVVAPTFALVAPLVIGTNRIATVPAGLAEYSARYLPIRVVPLPVEIPERVETLQWPRFQDDDPGSQWLRAILRNAARRLGAEERVSPARANTPRSR